MSATTRWALAALVGLALSVPFAARVSAQEAEAPACTDCHDVDVTAFETTVHGAFACTDCHAGAAQEEHDAETARADCASCHGDAVEALAGSIHGRPELTTFAKDGACSACHGPIHRLVPSTDPASPVHPAKLPATCGQCHASAEMAERFGFQLTQPLAAYQASVHARAVVEGRVSATCSSCHGAHDILPQSDPRSKVAAAHVAETCGTCHGDISTVFLESVHGQAVAKGIDEAPTCTDCHGEHRILSPSDRASPVFASNVPAMTCGRCHGDLRLSEKFGMPSMAVKSFEDSFHGLAGRTGDATVANCASCHGVHDILPSTDPRSHIHAENLAATCGSCHPGAGERFALGPVHMLPEDRESAHPAVYWVRHLYLWLIWLVIGGMVLHNLLDLRRKALSPVVRPVVPVAARRQRLNLGFRIAHGATALAFIVLAYTGFALAYPEAWWAAPLLRWEESIALRGFVHRVAAVVMLVAFAGHFVHLAVDRRARACILAMWPGKADLRELWERLSWYLGRRREMPHAPAVGYIEKAEYLALMWGTAVMALTGFLLWFEGFSLRWLPKWVSDVSTVIHFYEAVLATLAILVWHFYWVMLDPLVYPMDTSWLNGREPAGRTLERTASVVEPKEPKERPKREEGPEPAGSEA